MLQDYFAELYVAGLMANAEWNVYFPHRDKGMDFIISKTGQDGKEIIRPVQVKGKYPASEKATRLPTGMLVNSTKFILTWFLRSHILLQINEGLLYLLLICLSQD